MRRLIRFATYLYPASWRKRYETEFTALLEDLNPSWKAFVDTLCGALAMQIRTWNAGRILSISGIVGALIGMGASLATPRQYASKAVIRIVNPSLGDVSAPNQAIITYVTRAADGVLSPSSLSHIAETSGLRGKETAPIDGMIKNMKKRISLAPVPSLRGAPAALNIGFVSENPLLAQRVTQELTGRFMDEIVHHGISNGGPNVAFEITDAPSLPTRPLSSHRWEASASGLAAGMLLGTLISLLRRSLTPA